ncbi:MAG TPA: hypothetical protein VF131_11060 [Blastocatellia bacterium]|nr:hypothetical protein [Blastocatellia bacterium]
MRTFTPVDDAVLEIICSHSIKKNENRIQTKDLMGSAEQRGISPEAVYDSLRLFADDYQIYPEQETDGKIESFTVSARGYDTYARVVEPAYITFTIRTFEAIKAEGITNSKTLAEYMGRHPVVLNLALAVLEQMGYIKTTKADGDTKTIELTEEGNKKTY